MADIIRFVRVTGRADGMDAVAAALLRVRDAENQVTQAGEVLARTDPLRAYTNWQSRMDPSIRAMRTFRGEIDLVSRQFEKVRSEPGAFDQFGRDVDAAKRKLQDFGVELSRRQGIDQSDINRLLEVRPVPSGQARESASVFQSEFKRQDSDEADRVTAALREQRAEYDRLGRSRADLLQRNDPLGAAQERYNTALAEAKTLVDQRRISEAQYAAIIKGEETTFKNIQRDFGEGKAGFRAHQRVNLGYQANDVIGGLIMGQSPFMVAAQQGPQIAQILGDHEGGLGGGVKALAQDFLGLVTPARVGFGAVAAGATLASIALYRVVSQQQDVERALLGIGRASGVSAGQIERYAQNLPSRSGLSVGEARSAFATFAGTGRIGGEIGAQLTTLSRDYARASGQTLEEANKDLAASFADPAKGADTLAEKIGGISPRAIQAAKQFAAMNDMLNAQRSLLPELRQNLTSYRDTITGAALAADDARIGISKLFDSIGKSASLRLGMGQVDEQLQYLKDAQKAIQGYGPFRLLYDEKYIQEQIDKLQKVIDKRKEAAGAADLAKRAGVAESSIRAAIPDIERQEALDAAYFRLKDRNNDPAVQAKLSAEARDAQAGAERRYYEAARSNLTNDERLAEQHQITLRGILANTAAQEAAVAAEQKTIDAAGDVTKAYRAKQDALNATTETLARYTKAAQDAARQSEYDVKAAGLLPYPRARQQLQNELDEKIRAHTDQLTGKINNEAELRREYANKLKLLNTDQLGGPIQQAGLNIKELAGQLDVAQKSFYATAEQAGYYAERQRLINEYTRMGKDNLAAEMPLIEEKAKAYAKLVGEMDKVSRAQRNVVEGMDEQRTALRGGITGVLSDLRQGKDPRQGLLNALNRSTDAFIDRIVSKPLTESLLGQDGKAGGGMFGDLLSKAFGTGMQTANMSVQAASVVINGGLGGLGIPGLGSSSGAGQGAPGTQGAQCSGGLFGWLGLGGTAAATAASTMGGRTIVQDGSGRVLSYGGSGGLPITVNPSGVEPTQGGSAYGGAGGLLSGFGALIGGGKDIARAASPGDSLSGRSAYDILGSSADARDRVPTAMDRLWSQVRERDASRFGSDADPNLVASMGPSLLKQAEAMRSTMSTATDATGALGGAAQSAAGGVGDLATSLTKALGNIGPSNFGLGGVFGVGSAQAAETGFAVGGWTGWAGRGVPVGVVHGQEYVFSAPAVQRIGLGTLDAMHRGVPGYADGGFVGASIVGPQPVALPPMPTPALAAVPAPGLSGASHSGPQQISLQVDVTGARGNAEITEMVHRGVAAGLEQYDRKLNRTLPGRLAEHQRRFG